MSSERWRKIDQLFHAALEREPSERVAFLSQACAGDDPLLEEIQSLIESHEKSDSFIETPAGDVAAEMLGCQECGFGPGQHIGNYRIVHELGSGGMGEVYLADDTRLNRKIALKLLPPQFTIQPDRVRRFEREARAASALNHPNIVTIYEIGQSNFVHFIATEFVDGKTLRQLMNEKPLTLREALNVGIQVGGALAGAHAAGIVHRDIKPENIMIRADGYVKILDFGLAKLTEPQSTDSDPEMPTLLQSNPGLVMGTVQYMSPEQARGKNVGVRTDIWSLGIVLYELLAGRVPFSGETPSHVMVSLMEDEHPPLTSYANVPAELDRIVTKALRKNQKERYQSASEFAHDLKKLKEELQLEARLKVFLEAVPGSREGETKTDGMTVGHAPASTASTVATGTAHPTSSAEYLVTELKRHPRAVVLLAAVVLAVVALTAAYFFYRASRSEAIDSVAVLPFINAGGDPQAEYLSEGISDNIINSLSRLPNLRVSSLSTVLRYKGKQVDPQAVGSELKVRALVIGRLVQSGDSLTISTELVDVRDNRRLWGEQYKRKLSDILIVQNEIARDISERLRRLSGEEQKRLAKHNTENPEAYELYLKGRYFFDKRTIGAVRQSKEYFRKAIEKDPNYALAYAGLANAYTPGDFILLPPDTMVEAKAAAKKALEIDDHLAAAHTAQARVLLFYDLDWRGGERELKRAIELNPNDTEAHHMYSHYLIYQGQIEQSLAESERALEIDPLDVVLNVHLGWHYLYARQPDRAIEQMHKSIEMDPNFFRAHLYLGRAYEQKGMYKEALAAYRRATDLEADTKETAVMLGHLHAVSGNRAEAVRILEELKTLYQRKKISAYDPAIIHAGLGENDQALEWLKKAYEERFGGLLSLKTEPLFDGLRSDPRYRDLLWGMNLEP